MKKFTEEYPTIEVNSGRVETKNLLVNSKLFVIIQETHVTANKILTSDLTDPLRPTEDQTRFNCYLPEVSVHMRAFFCIP